MFIRRLVIRSMVYAAAIACASPAWSAPPDCSRPTGLRAPSPATLAPGLAHLEGGRAASTALPPARLYALYVGASWCGPCRLFARKLKPVYESGDPQRLGYEVIFLSRDRTAREAYDYVRAQAMPWPFLRFEQRDKAKEVQGARDMAPDLVVVDAAGRVYCQAYDETGRYLGVYETYQAMRRALQAPL